MTVRLQTLENYSTAFGNGSGGTINMTAYGQTWVQLGRSGHLLVVQAQARDTSKTWNTPVGWTKRSDTNGHAVFTKRVDGSNEDSVAFSMVSGTCEYIIGGNGVCIIDTDFGQLIEASFVSASTETDTAGGAPADFTVTAPSVPGATQAVLVVSSVRAATPSTGSAFIYVTLGITAAGLTDLNGTGQTDLAFPVDGSMALDQAGSEVNPGTDTFSVHVYGSGAGARTWTTESALLIVKHDSTVAHTGVPRVLASRSTTDFLEFAGPHPPLLGADDNEERTVAVPGGSSVGDWLVLFTQGRGGGSAPAGGGFSFLNAVDGGGVDHETAVWTREVDGTEPSTYTLLDTTNAVLFLTTMGDQAATFAGWHSGASDEDDAGGTTTRLAFDEKTYLQLGTSPAASADAGGTFSVVALSTKGDNPDNPSTVFNFVYLVGTSALDTQWDFAETEYEGPTFDKTQSWVIYGFSQNALDATAVIPAVSADYGVDPEDGSFNQLVGSIDSNGTILRAYPTFSSGGPVETWETIADGHFRYTIDTPSFDYEGILFELPGGWTLSRIEATTGEGVDGGGASLELLVDEGLEWTLVFSGAASSAGEDVDPGQHYMAGQMASIKTISGFDGHGPLVVDLYGSLDSESWDALSTVATVDHDLLIGVEEDQHHPKIHPLDETVHTGGLFYKTVADATISDSDFTAPEDGMVGITYDTDSGISLMWARSEGTWKAVEVSP